MTPTISSVVGNDQSPSSTDQSHQSLGTLTPALPTGPSSPEELGWDSWGQKEFMTANRNWQAVLDFFDSVVRGRVSFSCLRLQEPEEFDLWRHKTPKSAATSNPDSNPDSNPSLSHVHILGGQLRTAEATAADLAVGVREAEVLTSSPRGEEPDAVEGFVMAGERSSDGSGRGARGRGIIPDDRRLSTAAGVGPKAGPRSGRPGGGVQRRTYKVTVSFFGPAFAGWAYQPGRRTLQGELETALQPLVDPAGADQHVVVSAAGRTDAGVHAYGMPFSFYSWRPLSYDEITRVVDSLQPGQLRVMRVEEVPRHFHATFSAVWRRYVYLFPLRPTSPPKHTTCQTSASSNTPNKKTAIDAAAANTSTSTVTTSVAATGSGGSCPALHPLPPQPPAAAPRQELLGDAGEVVAAGALYLPQRPPPPLRHSPPPAEGLVPRLGVIPPESYTLDPDPELMGRMLVRLEGRTLDFLACARDTPRGKDGMCVLHLCRCHVMELPPPSLLASGTVAAAISAATIPAVTTTVATERLLPLHEQPETKHPPQQDLKEPEPGSLMPLPNSSAPAATPLEPDPGKQLPAVPEPQEVAAGTITPRVLCIELVGNRFLRRMVRVLVSTALREATPGAGRCGGREDALLECLAAGRTATAMPAPAAGLCFAGAGYASL